MKKSILLVAIMAMFGVATAVAQPRAIGGQLGYGIEASYEHTIGNNFITADLGFPGWFIGGFNVMTIVTYNWLNPFGVDFPSVSQGDWNWYMGPGIGAGIGVGNTRYYTGFGTKGYERSNHFSSFIGAAGRFGVEYNFWFPLQLSAEWRPVIGPGFYRTRYYDDDGNEVAAMGTHGAMFNYGGLYMTAFALGVRYKF